MTAVALFTRYPIITQSHFFSYESDIACDSFFTKRITPLTQSVGFRLFPLILITISLLETMNDRSLQIQGFRRFPQGKILR